LHEASHVEWVGEPILERKGAACGNGSVTDTVAREMGILNPLELVQDSVPFRAPQKLTYPAVNVKYLPNADHFTYSALEILIFPIPGVVSIENKSARLSAWGR
jgi:hypothetical protein